MKRMPMSNTSSFLLFLLSALICGVHNLDYTDLETMGVACPQRDKCQGYRNNLTYLERSCECDYKCREYNDCCIDARYRRSTAGNVLTCMPYGTKSNAGVYVIDTCDNNWNGSSEISEKCLEPDDISDPVMSAPVTSIDEALTYRNRYCAECNNANMSSLTTFQLRMNCEGLEELSTEEIFSNITYNSNMRYWGLNRSSPYDNRTNFIGCDIICDVPDYLNNSVRFCRSDLISTCPATWNRDAVKKACSKYMAVVFDNILAYRNPHCAICNGKTVGEVSCTYYDLGRNRYMGYGILLDINTADGDIVGQTNTPQCSSSEKYDPFRKSCRSLSCGLPGYIEVNGRCVKE